MVNTLLHMVYFTIHHCVKFTVVNVKFNIEVDITRGIDDGSH